MPSYTFICVTKSGKSRSSGKHEPKKSIYFDPDPQKKIGARGAVVLWRIV